ncbi:hypothetical protein LJ655_15205 [Paraburkholderia sp. MMS20-SJTN17]|uniref:Uncharacterized protein n=1 Tax=Paraburkholderia translucens TaxID=2886945 RepID=A0ABS8KEL4_9BURK|nr:hypothetical protein [Paraburkholderia sp. MMS20-SJTN17]MCC8403220.1 hypothetical protein [Paraburkholderia sp. MMS20-SJTN17]
MSDETLRSYGKRYIEAPPTPEIEFTWQGGEPMKLKLTAMAELLDVAARAGGRSHDDREAGALLGALLNSMEISLYDAVRDPSVVWHVRIDVMRFDSVLGRRLRRRALGRALASVSRDIAAAVRAHPAD